MNNFLNLKKISLLIGDIAILYLSLYLTLLIRYGQLPSSELWQNHFWPFSAIFIIWIFIFYIIDLYNLILASNNVRFYALTAKALFVNFLIGTAFFYLIPQLSITPKRNLFIVTIITALLFLLWRQFFNLTLKSFLPKQNIAFIGINDQVKELVKYFQDHPHLGFNISFILTDKDVYPAGLYNIKIYKNIQKIKEYITNHKINTVILAENLEHVDELRARLFSCLSLNADFTGLYNFYTKILGKVPLYSVNQMWFLENLNQGGRLWFDKFKRIYDIILAFLILIFSLPFWPLIAIVIKLNSSGPVFYRQARIGRHGKIFSLIKFRSMVHEDKESMTRPTVPNDPRITRFGIFLRRTRIDEIPQVINIIKGQISFIGPRPERPELVSELQAKIPYYNERTLVLPGVSGWDQVCGEYHSPSLEDTIKKLQYDLYYIKNRSIWLDLIIILKTIRTVLGGGGV